MALPKRNTGKKSETIVQDALELLERQYPSTFIRLYDSTSAGVGSGGNFIPAQPGDFVSLLDTYIILIECKSSKVHLSLSETTLRNVFSDNQISGSRRWLRAGALSFCVFHSLPGNVMEIWDMQDVNKAYRAPPRQRKLTVKPLATFKANYAVLADELKSIAKWRTK
jgi:hypothetical protein